MFFDNGNIHPYPKILKKRVNWLSFFYPVSVGQRGNIFFTLFGAVGLVGTVGVMTTTVIKGPVTSMVRVTDHTIAKNDMIAASTLISEKSIAQDPADCDADGMIEPLEYRAPSGEAPSGGGWLPQNLGASEADPWHTPYGYCAWDHGAFTQSDHVADCGGGGARRLDGAADGGQPVIAILSAGPDKIFQSTCASFIDEDIPEVSRGGDDIVRLVPYGQFMMPSSAQARLDDLPDAACTGDTSGIMRMVLGVMQVCANGTWVDIAPASGGDMDFDPLTNVMLGTPQQSNILTLGVLEGSLPVSIGGGALVSINGGIPVASGTAGSGDTLQLFASAAPAPESTLEFPLQIGSVTKIWRVTTRDAYVGQLAVTPQTASTMNVTGPGSPAYGTTIGFIVTNMGERPTDPLNPAVLSNATNFAFDMTGGHVGDGCAGQVLQGSLGGGPGSCVIDVRSKASNDSAGFTGNLSVGDGTVSASATLSGTAAGWSCNLPWGGKIANGASTVAYATACSLLSCTSQSRVCSNGALSGSYQHQTCNVLLSCL